MREYKFRGRRIDNGEWVHGYLIEDRYIVGPVVEWTEDYFNTEFWLKVDPETVGQYTGLKDRNGKEIYEGDILEIGYYRYKVEFSEGCFGARDGYGFSPFRNSIWGMGGVILGNVFEHPHLLKGDGNDA